MHFLFIPATANLKMAVQQLDMSFSQPALDECEKYDTVFRTTEDVLDIPMAYYTSPNDVTVKAEGSRIIQFLRGKHVFLTGATGFVGVLTVEKLLRACPDIGQIYLLMRGKKGRDVNARAQKYFQNEIFDPLRKIFRNFQEKVTIVNGDISMDNLGLNQEDRNNLINNVQIIIHGAATVNFDEKFRSAVNINVRGTKHMIDLAKECKKLISFTYVSTAFSTTNSDEILEEVVPYNGSVQEILDIVEKYSDKELEDIGKKYMGDFPNTYGFTKYLAEQLIWQHKNDLPVCIFRPSMIMGTYREPLRGWTNNIYGPMAIIFLESLGLQHVILLEKEFSGNFIAADYVANGIIVASYKTAQDRCQIGKVYNFVNRPNVQYTHGEFAQNGINLKYKLMCSRTKLHAYCVLITSNLRLFRFLGFFLHYIPAFFLDLGLQIAGIKTPMKMTDAINKVHKLMELVRYYNVHEWKFHYDNVRKMWGELGQADKNAFPCNTTEINPKLHLISIFCGLRIFIAKDPLETVPKARRMYQKIEYGFFALYAIMATILFIYLNKLYNFIFL